MQSSSSRGIPRIRAAAPEVAPTTQVSSTERSPQALRAANTRPNAWLATVLGGTVDMPVFRDSGVATTQETQKASQEDGEAPEMEGSTENIDGGESPTIEKVAKPPRKRKARAAKDGLPKRRKAARGRRKAAEDDVDGAQEAQEAQEEQEGQGDEQEVAGGTEVNAEGDNSDNSLYKDPQKSDKPGKTRRPRKPAAKKPPKEPSEPNRKRSSGRHRAPSPEDGEQREITPSVIKMKDLCRDIRIGRKSKRFIELEQMDWTKLANDQKAAKAALEVRQAAGEEVERETVEESIEGLGNEGQRYDNKPFVSSCLKTIHLYDVTVFRELAPRKCEWSTVNLFSTRNPFK